MEYIYSYKILSFFKNRYFVLVYFTMIEDIIQHTDLSTEPKVR